jgi:hypothetical protein
MNAIIPSRAIAAYYKGQNKTQPGKKSSSRSSAAEKKSELRTLMERNITY